MKLLSLFAILVCVMVTLPASGQPALQGGPSDTTADTTDLLQQAEPLYQSGNYKDALAVYMHAQRSSTAPGTTAAKKIRCLRYLADCFFRLKQPDDALSTYQQIDSLIDTADAANQVINLDDKAACLGLKDDYAGAEKLCRSAAKLCTGSDPEMRWQLARTEAQLGYFDYMRANYASAINNFRQAEIEITESGRVDLPALILRQKLAFAQAGSYYHLRNFELSYEQFRRLYDLDVRLLGKTDLQTGWAMLAMSDVLEKTKQISASQEWYHKACYVFRTVNRDRLTLEFAPLAARIPDLHQRINEYIFGISTIPSDLQNSVPPLSANSSILVSNHDPRALYAGPFTDAPAAVWLNPAVARRGIVIAIHGLSLQHQSYDALARRLADEGFCTMAFDMRGFGAYRQALGAENLDFDGCMNDLQAVVKAIKGDNPGVPLFILGESMGGAIAVQFAAQNRQLIDGLVASVPAGRRFHDKRTAAKVALHYMQDKNRPIDIGTDVINQATHDPKVKAAWSLDPKTRGTLSPRELLAFQQMCNRNVAFAKQIDALPVMIFQGVEDGLVKPEATYDLFRAVTSKDKTLVMVGNAEHLIFEEGCFSEPVLKGLEAWIESHIRSPKS